MSQQFCDIFPKSSLIRSLCTKDQEAVCVAGRHDVTDEIRCAALAQTWLVGNDRASAGAWGKPTRSKMLQTGNGRLARLATAARGSREGVRVGYQRWRVSREG